MEEKKEPPKQLMAPKKKKGIRISFGHYSEQLGYTIKEIFIGKRTIFSIAGFIVGGIMVGRSAWEYSMQYLGLPLTIIVGLVIFVFSGLSLHEFREMSDKESIKHHEDDLLP